jgi:hypothetical protein
MSERTYTAQLKGRQISLTDDQLSAFRQAYIGDSELGKRMSELIWFDMYVLDAEFGVSPHDILSAIRELEAGETQQRGIKPATQFKNPPLKGLWHKHFFSAHFLVGNILRGLGKNGLEKLVTKVMDPNKSPVITQEMINELVHRVTNEPLEMREAAKKLTGEWIVFLKRGRKNYYLCVNTHNAGDQVIYNRIMTHCVRDFPDLPAWLKAQQ